MKVIVSELPFMGKVNIDNSQMRTEFMDERFPRFRPLSNTK